MKRGGGDGRTVGRRRPRRRSALSFTPSLDDRATFTAPAPASPARQPTSKAVPQREHAPAKAPGAATSRSTSPALPTSPSPAPASRRRLSTHIATEVAHRQAPLDEGGTRGRRGALAVAMRQHAPQPTLVIAEIAGRQHGVVTAAQLADGGIDKRLSTARCERGGCIGCTAASTRSGIGASRGGDDGWRRCSRRGTGRSSSHTSAAALWEFLRPIQGPIHVTVAATARRKPRPGLVDPPLPHPQRRRDITRRHGIAVTTPARTIEDIRGDSRALSLPPRAAPGGARRAPRAAPRPRPSARAPTSSCSSSPSATTTGCRGRSSTTASTGTASTSSGRSSASRSRPTAGSTTAGRSRFEDDHARDLALRAHGITTRRYTGDQLEAAPEAVVADLREALGRAS